MSDRTDQKPKPIMTFVFDEVTVLTQKAETNPQAKIKPPLSESAPLVTIQADEMTEFVVKAIAGKDLASQNGKT